MKFSMQSFSAKKLSHLIVGSCLGLSAIGFSGVTFAQSGDALKNLATQVSKDIGAESSRNAEREKRFREAAGEQKALLQEVQQKVAAEEKLRDDMKVVFDNNEVRLGELTTVLDRRSGNLGELFGVFRQVAGDTQKILFDSLITIEHPDRNDTIELLASSTEVPTIAQMEQLWSIMLQEIAESGTISRFETDIIKPSGETYRGAVTRIGSFNIISGDKYLSYLSDTQQVSELARQPAGSVRSTADALSKAQAGSTTGFAIDPSRGALLGMMVQAPSFMERVHQGKEVGYAIMAVGVLGLLLVLERMLKLGRISSLMRKQQKDMEHASSDNPLGRMMAAYYENRHLNDLDVLGKKLDEVVFKDISELRKGLATIKVLAAIAPLMGLLGTVTGMISTFQAITLFGTGDPKIMAGGISQALITTVQGLCVAIPLLLASNMLSARAQQLSKTIGEQATGLIADKAEDIAKAKAA